MPSSNRVSIVDAIGKKNLDERNDSQRSAGSIKIADFDTALVAAGYGKFHFFLFLSIIPVSWASSFDTGNMSMILPSAECDLNLSLFYKGILNAVVYIGMMSSGIVWGYLADVKGRRSIIIYGFLADGIFNVLVGFSQNFWTLVFFKLISGIIISGPYACMMTYCSEFYLTKDRPRILLIVAFSVAAGTVINAGLAWVVVPQAWSIVLWDGYFVYNSWRIFLSLCGVPTLLGAFCLCFFPESPKFLMSQGRNEEALDVFRLIYRVNTNQPKDTYPIRALMDESEVTSGTDGTTSNKCGFKEGMRQMMPMFHKPCFSRLILVVAMQFCGMLGLNTIRLWQPQLFTVLEHFNPLDYNITDHNPNFCEIMDISTSFNANATSNLDTMKATNSFTDCQKIEISESMYMDSTIVSLSSNLSLLIASIFVNTMGHKNILFTSYGISLACLLIMNWSTHTLLTLALVCLFVGLMSTTFNAVIGVTVLMFPTTLRTMAVSLEMAIGRLGSMLGNLVFPILLGYGCIAPISALASFTLMSIILTYFIPNVRQRNENEKV